MIEVKNYKKSYKKTDIILSDFNLYGRISIIIGPNGSGKSTFLKSVAGFIRYQGTITFSGSLLYYAESLTYPEDASVIDFYNAFISFHGCDPSYQLLTQFDLTKKLESKIATLSKGEKNKLGLVSILSVPSTTYLLDEPLSGLDKKSAEELLKFIKNSSDRFIITTHIKSELIKISKEVIEFAETSKNPL